jgi:hypothetical protein
MSEQLAGSYDSAVAARVPTAVQNEPVLTAVANRAHSVVISYSAWILLVQLVSTTTNATTLLQNARQCLEFAITLHATTPSASYVTSAQHFSEQHEPPKQHAAASVHAIGRFQWLLLLQ